MIDWKSKTKSELDSEANAINWENSYHEIMKRLYPNSSFEYGDMNMTGELLYNEIKPFQTAGEIKIYDNKYPWSDVLTEVSEYKSDELAKIDRVFRGVALWNWYNAKESAGVFTGNMSREEFIYLLESTDAATMTLLETKDLENKNKHDFDAGVIERKRKMEVGMKCIATVNYLNDLNNATDVQISAQLSDSDVSMIMQSLQAGSLARAKAMIQGKDLTGLEPMDQTYKDKVIELIDSYMGA